MFKTLDEATKARVAVKAAKLFDLDCWVEREAAETVVSAILAGNGLKVEDGTLVLDPSTIPGLNGWEVDRLQWNSGICEMPPRTGRE